ncbi:peptide deformylase [Patescibacteria group bacterium]
MQRPIVFEGDPRVRIKTEKVADPTLPEIQQLIDDMIETMHKNQGIGLAATQIGRTESIAIAHLHEEDIALINPEIIEKSEDKILDDEGCLSAPGLQGKVDRAAHVKVHALDRTGQPIEIEAEGLEARILQHEIDHLNGILCIDYFDK